MQKWWGRQKNDKLVAVPRSVLGHLKLGLSILTCLHNKLSRNKKAVTMSS